MRRALAALPFLLPLAACVGGDETQDLEAQVEGVPEGAGRMLVAGGCFWCVESDFEHLDGIYEVVSGYSGGEMPNPTYENHGEHLEVARIYYDPAAWDYARLAERFLRTIDPTDAGGQFCDRGHSYTTAIFYETEDEREAAETAVAEAADELGQAVVTPVRKAGPFTAAEAYHQDFYEKSPVRYRYYRASCGRDARVEALWGEAAS
ncbi:peptide-methionine (S)-S-oxide reductase MsrA [Parvularcula dongshanensis]|uniref:Peptide methionine sulfoxide reductase MsrA n=1 Tax=Parvularcula dongshanensis TaxID=1173995 RepID=A0A840I2W2_9PROT|nr:peptide-methionine (S)-S-oxide reductase MsrA [Parvularcula dongshanensis]MBB4658642.1 peptide-methionine (S)-S-oxide reductase [Parvularcula dongshanensis]